MIHPRIRFSSTPRKSSFFISEVSRKSSNPAIINVDRDSLQIQILIGSMVILILAYNNNISCKTLFAYN